MPKITNWSQQQRSPKLVYSNDVTRARATVLRTPASWRHKWTAVITIDGYTIWARNFDTKADAADRLREELRARPEPILDCTKCGTEIDYVVENERGDDTVKYHFDCPECGHEAPSRWVPAGAV